MCLSAQVPICRDQSTARQSDPADRNVEKRLTQRYYDATRHRATVTLIPRWDEILGYVREAARERRLVRGRRPVVRPVHRPRSLSATVAGKPKGMWLYRIAVALLVFGIGPQPGASGTTRPEQLVDARRRAH